MEDLREFFIKEMKSKRLECRAWDIRNKEMIKVDDIQWRDLNTYKVNNIKFKPKKKQSLMINTNGAWRMEDEIILMWHFGHLDRNKNKLFEGDIIKFCDDNCYCMVAFYNKELAELCFKAIDGTIFSFWDYLVIDGNIDGEIIGNIFENYDLLEEKEGK